MFRVFVEVMGVLEPSTRIELLLDDVVGALARAVAVVAEHGVNLLGVTTRPGQRPGTRAVVLRLGTINPTAVLDALATAGFDVQGPEASR